MGIENPKALEKFVEMIDHATRADIEAAIAHTASQAHAPTIEPTRRKIWLDMGRLLRRQGRRFP